LKGICSEALAQIYETFAQLTVERGECNTNRCILKPDRLEGTLQRMRQSCRIARPRKLRTRRFDAICNTPSKDFVGFFVFQKQSKGFANEINFFRAADDTGQG
jgi:hypothetical protein